jgi:hypothetical protein
MVVCECFFGFILDPGGAICAGVSESIFDAGGVVDGRTS